MSDPEITALVKSRVQADLAERRQRRVRLKVTRREFDRRRRTAKTRANIEKLRRTAS